MYLARIRIDNGQTVSLFRTAYLDWKQLEFLLFLE
jgi:hypothetical protein